MGKFGEILLDAATLEVNSILVDGISGRKMPGVRIAFLETVGAWADQLERLCERLRRIGVPPVDAPIRTAAAAWLQEKDRLEQGDYSPRTDEPLLNEILNGAEMIAFRKGVSVRLKGHPEADALMAEINRLMKIQSRLAIIRSHFQEHLRERNGGKDENVANRAAQELRKLWELKDGYIFAQNVIQLDGDIITRYNRRLFQDRQLKAQVGQLIAFHNKHVDVGMKHWHFLIDTIVGIAKALGETIVSPFR